MTKIIIAIDGQSACGKSTLAKALAKELKYIYVDSGAMYRAVTYFCILNNLISNTNKIIEMLNEINISFNYNRTKGSSDTFLNGKNVEHEIRSIKVSQHVSEISKIKEVRLKLVEFQQQLGKTKGIVMDGRDIGTVVFPNAELKLWITANQEVRTARRYKELIEKEHKVTFEEVKTNLAHRDFEDANRTESPLLKANDAIVLDNSYITKEETLNKAINLVRKKIESL